jgi:2-dehydro-3-deoxyphosphogluconate aldolase/(4S)-4-hydroxy-2-oxoglutarate aldolase
MADGRLVARGRRSGGEARRSGAAAARGDAATHARPRACALGDARLAHAGQPRARLERARADEPARAASRGVDGAHRQLGGQRLVAEQPGAPVRALVRALSTRALGGARSACAAFGSGGPDGTRLRGSERAMPMAAAGASSTVPGDRHAPSPGVRAPPPRAPCAARGGLLALALALALVVCCAATAAAAPCGSRAGRAPRLFEARPRRLCASLRRASAVASLRARDGGGDGGADGADGGGGDGLGGADGCVSVAAAVGVPRCDAANSAATPAPRDAAAAAAAPECMSAAQLAALARGEEAVARALLSTGVLALISLREPKHAAAVVRALAAGGVRTVEVLLRTPRALEVLASAVRAARALSARGGPAVAVGAGTVLSVAQVEAAARAGASFLMSPTCDAAVVRAAQLRGLPLWPGVGTAAELRGALRLGCRVVKVYPAEQLGGPAALRELGAPHGARVALLPTGGMRTEHISGYLAQPQVLAVAGSWLVVAPEAGGADAPPDLRATEAAARAAVAEAARARAEGGAAPCVLPLPIVPVG